MSTFKIGEKVVCIDDSSPRRKDLRLDIKRNEIYTIRKINISKTNGEITFCLDEIIGAYCSFWESAIGYYSWRFRKLDYQFAENLLAELTQSAKSEYQLN